MIGGFDGWVARVDDESWLREPLMPLLD